MSNVNFILLYVENVARSADFYSRLLDKPVPESSPGFAMLPVAPPTQQANPQVSYLYPVLEPRSR